MVVLVCSGCRALGAEFESRLGALPVHHPEVSGRAVVWWFNCLCLSLVHSGENSAWPCGVRPLPSGAGRDHRWTEAPAATAASSVALGANPVGL